jgi:drug/metabolite transporter (DMT)-like permease
VSCLRCYVAALCLVCLFCSSMGLGIRRRFVLITSPEHNTVERDLVYVTDVPQEGPYRSNSLTPSGARLTLSLVAGLYGLDYSLTKALQERLPPVVISFIKYGASMLYFLPQSLQEPVDARTVRVGLELGMWCTIYAISVANAVQTTAASKVSFIACLAIMLPPVYDAAVTTIYDRTSRDWLGDSKDEPTATHRAYAAARTILRSPFIAPLLAMRGVYLMSATHTTEVHAASLGVGKGLVWKDALLLVSPIASSLCYWRSERLAAERRYSPQGATTVMLGTVAALTLLFSVVRYGLPLGALGRAADWTQRHCSGTLAYMDGSSVTVADGCGAALMNLFQQHWRTAGTLAVSSLLVTGWNTVTEQRALSVVSAAEAYLVLSLEPFFATLFAALLLGEAVGANTAHAAVYIVAASSWRYLAGWVDKQLVERVQKLS